MKTQVKANGLMPGSNLLYFNKEDLPKLAQELSRITIPCCTEQDAAIATNLYNELSAHFTWKPAILGAIFYAGQIMGVRAERAKRSARK